MYDSGKVLQEWNRPLTYMCLVYVQTYGMGGENLRGLTEKLRAIAHTFQMAIQSHWRRNSYDGRSTTKLPAGILQAVVDLITSAKGLFSLLNRFVKRELSNRYIYSTPNSILFCCYFFFSAVSCENSSDCSFCFIWFSVKRMAGG